ncbi:MAG: beta-galactosidase [Bacteroidota bacterium]|nr:beta-galactosidase [Bacteroidota bacterium]
MRKGLLLMSFLFSVSGTVCAQASHRFALADSVFLLDGKPFQIISGEMHPARIAVSQWRHRIRMAKAMGCNTIAVYAFWNYFEERQGLFDFRTDKRDIAAFIRLCQQEGMWVLLRPGPYVCGEWDLGGIPSWLLKYPDIRLRCMDPKYIQAVTTYIKQLSAQVKPLLVTNGGPILMVQIENEYGSYGNDKVYLEYLRTQWQSNGINTPFYTADGPTDFMLEAGNIDGAAIGLDSGSSEADFEQAKKRSPHVPSFSSETYPGWLTHWGEPWARPDTAALRKEINFLLSHKKSFNLYVVHGGTNFGFTAGANAFSPTQYQPDITSYDYDAPISEQGLPTPKYFLLRDLIQSYTGKPLPPVPAPPASISIAAITMQPYTTIWKALGKPVHSPQPLTMEVLGQNQGLVLYRTTLIGHKSGKLTITEPHDYALVFLDGKLIDTIYRDGGHWSVNLPATPSKNPVLEILVEGMGHINFAQYMIDRKGITERVTLNGMTLMNWQQFLLPMNADFVSALPATYPEGFHDGIFFKGKFNLATTGDTWFDMGGYTKGMLYVNGHNLGRYWTSRGPQQKLFCPAEWLRKGANDIVVFDFHANKAADITATERP